MFVPVLVSSLVVDASFRAHSDYAVFSDRFPHCANRVSSAHVQSLPGHSVPPQLGGLADTVPGSVWAGFVCDSRNCLASCIKCFSTCRVGPIRVQFNQMLPDLLSVLPTVIARQVQSLESSFSLNDLYLVSDSLRRTLSVGCDGWMACRRSIWSFFVESFPLATKY